jgi:hypothetical protein
VTTAVYNRWRKAAQAVTGGPGQPINVVADAGYSNGEQAEACEASGILPHVPANRSVNNDGDGTLFDRSEFTHQSESDTLLCRPGRLSLANNYHGKIVLCSMQHNPKFAERFL